MIKTAIVNIVRRLGKFCEHAPGRVTIVMVWFVPYVYFVGLGGFWTIFFAVGTPLMFISLVIRFNKRL